MKALIGLLYAAAGFYLLLSLLIYLFQGKLVFLPNMPGRALEACPADIGLQYQDVWLSTGDGERLHGWFVPAAASRGVLLFFHGNAGNISHRLDSIRIFNELNLDVLIVDYRGYGQSSGKPSEQGTYADAEAAWSYLVGERGTPPGQIVVFGRSLGGAVAAWLGTQATPAGTIIESSFTSGVDMARRLYPFLPVKLLTRLRYPVRDYAARLESPVLVVHSRQDEIIPFSMGQAIFEAVTPPKRFIELRGDHNNGFYLSRETYVAGLAEFLDEALN